VTYPLPVPAVAKTTVIKDWITSLGWDVTSETGYPLFSGPEIVTSPDKAVFITLTPGPGWVTEEGAVDVFAFQARVRGPADDPDMPLLMMQRLDVLIMNARSNVVVDGVLIMSSGRSGGTPSPLPANPEDRRFEYTCTYLLTTGLE
jgi:hypothetical protein